MYYPFCHYRVWEFVEFSGKTREHMPSAAVAAPHLCGIPEFVCCI